MHAQTLVSYLNTLAAAEPDKRLLGCEERWLTAAEVLAQRDARAAAFHRQGIACGDWVALRAERGVDAALSLLALRALGAVVVLCDPRQEPAAALSDCDTPIGVRASVADGTVKFWDAAENPSMGRDAAFVIFTSGSTGKSKAVVLSEDNLISNLLDSAPLGCYFEDDIALGALPLHHVFGLVLLAGTMVLNYALFFPREVGIPALLKCIERERITRMNGVPSLYLALAEQSAAYDLRSLRAGFIGGGPVTVEQFVRIEQVLGLTLISVYGMSECIGISCASWRDP